MEALWNILLLQPILNALVAFSVLLGGSFGLAIIAVTVIVRIILWPLSLRQLRVTQKLSTLQPKLKELQQKYRGDKERLSREQWKLYREGGANPMSLGCILPMLVQFPIWIAVFQSITQALAATPEGLFELSKHLYPWPFLDRAAPLEGNFLWLELSKTDPYFIMPALTFVSMWVQMKMSATPPATPQAATQNTMMQFMMPVMFAVLTLQFPSGLAVYWVASTVIGVVMQYFVTGWGPLLPSRASKAAPAPTAEAGKDSAAPAPEKGRQGGKSRPDRGKRRNR